MMQSELIDRLRKKDDQAIRELVDKYQDYIYTIARRIVKNKELAEEVTQDVFVKVMNKMHTFKGTSKFSTWLFTIVYRTSLNYLDKPNFKSDSIETIFWQDKEIESPSAQWSSGSPENEEQKRILWHGIDKLSEQQGVAISLFYLQQFAIEEIAQIMGVPANTVKSLLFRGRKHLKSILLQKYETEDIL